ncbi:aldo/keto reductase [Lentzea sp. JNUCC 0626]|uniref:aldo/keto reductase n=1 Tax=Lentzea sp. JNUCC 0626 TaxID=3367513 RepID=UPI003749962A
MQYRTLGKTGLWVSEVSLGAMTFGGATDHPIWGAVGALDVAQARRLVDEALDAGVNLIDTADVYADGESENHLGEILEGRRDQVLIATKAMARFGPGPNDLGATRVHLLRSIERSLRRLRTDHIDLFQLHNTDSVTPMEETLSALDDAVRQGKVRHIGVANFPAWQITKALGISALKQLNGFVALQAHYSLLVRDLEAEILPMVESENIGLTVWGPLAAGYLTGKFDAEGNSTDPWSRRAKAPQAIPPVDPSTAAPIVHVVREVAERNGTSMPQVALAWLLARPAVTSVTIGARTVEQLRDNLAAVENPLAEKDLAELDAISAPAPVYPKWINDYSASVRGPVPLG